MTFTKKDKQGNEAGLEDYVNQESTIDLNICRLIIPLPSTVLTSIAPPSMF